MTLFFPPEDTFPWTKIFTELLDNDEKVIDGCELPQTGFSEDYEKIHSSIKVEQREIPVSILQLVPFCIWSSSSIFGFCDQHLVIKKFLDHPVTLQ